MSVPIMPRRRFLQTNLGVAASVLAGASAGAVNSLSLLHAGQDRTAMEALPIVDTHQHLWDLNKLRLPWTADVPALKKNFLMSDYLAAVRGLNVVQTVYMEVDVDPPLQSAEADYVIDLCQQDNNPMTAAVIGGHPASEGFAEYIARYRKSPYVKGVRQVLHGPGTPRGYCLQDPFIAGVQKLGELGLRFDICIRPAELADAAKLIERCPNTRFILDHCGNEPPKTRDHSAWQRAIAQVARQKNVVCKVSGIVDKATDHWDAEELAPVVNHTLEVFGPDRVMFGGDWPVCNLGGSLQRWVETLQEIVKERSEVDRRKLFAENAIAFYGLKQAQPR